MNEYGKSSNVLASVFFYGGSWDTDSVVTLVPVLTSPFAMPTLLVERHNIRSHAFFLSSSLMDFLSAPELYVTVIASCGV